MKHFYKSFLLIIIYFQSGHAQHFPQHSQYYLNNFLINPALAGIEEYADIKISGRKQWTNVTGAPLTNYLSAHMPLNFNEKPQFRKQNNRSTERMQKAGRVNKLKPHHGIGGIVLNDQSGNYQRLDFNLAYSYHLPLSNKLRLAFGISGGGSYRNIDFGQVRLANANDPVIGAGGERRWQPIVNVGGWLYHQSFYVGTSFLRYLRSDRFSNIENINDEIFSEQFFITAGYKREINPNFKIIPSFLIKKVIFGSPFQVDANLKFILYDRLWGGISFREFQTVNPFIGLVLSHSLEVNYTYDFGVGGFDRYSVGNHEILIGLRIKNRKKIHCPNYFW